MQHVVSFEARPSAINQTIDDLLAGGEVCAPVKLESVVNLLRVRAAVHVDDQRISLALTEVRGKVQADLGLVFPIVDWNVQIGDLWQTLRGKIRREFGVVNQSQQSLIGIGLVQINLEQTSVKCQPFTLSDNIPGVHGARHRTWRSNSCQRRTRSCCIRRRLLWC